MKEKLMFSIESLEVTKTHLITKDQQYALGEIVAVKHGVIEPNRGVPSLCILIGLILLNSDNALIIVGGFSIFLGAIALSTSKTIYTVVIDTIHGQHQAFMSESSDAVDKAIRAINKAIINR